MAEGQSLSAPSTQAVSKKLILMNMNLTVLDQIERISSETDEPNFECHGENFNEELQEGLSTGKVQTTKEAENPREYDNALQAVSGHASDAAAPVIPPKPVSGEDIEETWRYLEFGLEKTFQNLKDIDVQTHMSLYSSIHNYCTAGHRRGGGLTGEELYNRLSDHIRRYLQGIYEAMAARPDDALLKVYIGEWQRYTAASQRNTQIYRFLDRHWVKREIDEGRDICDISTLHLKLWKEEVLGDTRSDVKNTLLRLVKDRSVVKMDFTREVIESFTLLGIQDAIV